MILGHEAAGVVTGLGVTVTEFAVGDRVCMEPGVPDSQGWDFKPVQFDNIAIRGPALPVSPHWAEVEPD